MFRADFWRHFDYWLLGAVILANAFGIAMINSAIAGNQELTGYATRQLNFALIGLAVILVVAAIDYHIWGSIKFPMYAVMTILLVMIYLGGREEFGATRWFAVAGIFIQPTELAKVVAILVLSHFFEKNRDMPRNWRWILVSFLWVAWLAGWIFIQPNLSNVVVIMVIWVSMLWVMGLPLTYVLGFSLGGALLALAAVFAPFSPLEDYQRQRVFTFLFPDPNASYGATYNVLQALIAIGSGGLDGKGYGHGTQTQLRFLKVRHTDFIFAASSEEFGFIGAVFILLLLLFIVYRCLRAARLAADVNGRLIAYGVAILIFFQAAINIAVNLNLIPVTGIPIPFISYGGSGLLSLMLGVGLVESVALRHKKLEF
ncbi:MAG: rod shape-determining protein RodA [Chloroflexi bacterium]|nr:rod shape-determining protein RodA [Chloroflexota bacterium]